MSYVLEEINIARNVSSLSKVTYQFLHDIFPDVSGRILLALEQILAMKMV